MSSSYISPRRNQFLKQSLNFAFDSTMMQSNEDLKEMTYDQAKKYLKCSTEIYEINHYLASGEIKSYMNSDSLSNKIPPNSPKGSFVSLELPFSKSESLSRSFQKLNSDQVRVGKILEMMDSVSADVALQYISENQQNAYSVTAAVDGVSFNRLPSIKYDMKIQSYISRAGTTSMVNRVDLFQRIEQG